MRSRVAAQSTARSARQPPREARREGKQAMTDTRRAMLQGLALAPIAGAAVVLAPTQATAAPGALRDLSTDALLERAMRMDPDAAFRALCADWLVAIQENRAAFAAWE